MFCKWLDVGAAVPDAKDATGRGEACGCAAAMMRFAIDQQGVDMRGSVSGNTAWEICCREFGQPDDMQTLSTRDIAALIVFWLDTGVLPKEMAAELYEGMVEDLHAREKTSSARHKPKLWCRRANCKYSIA